MEIIKNGIFGNGKFRVKNNVLQRKKICLLKSKFGYRSKDYVVRKFGWWVILCQFYNERVLF